jgi:two-component system cell cycle sensor histidine kinase/response regulator CckA
MIMPDGIDGLTTYEKIKKNNPEQRAVIASGFSESSRVKQAQKIGAGVYIKKPYTVESLAKGIYQELNN